MSFAVVALTDTGRARPHNEDYVDHYLPQDQRLAESKGGIYLVADGMGGHQAGEVASRKAIKLVIEQYYSDLTHDVGTSLVRAYKAANRLIHDEAQSDPAKAGMGTTLVAAVVTGRKVYVANVGDSRAYLVGQDRIAQITEDHSWVQEQIRAGLLTREQARLHPQRNVVTRALGSKPSVEVDLFEGHLADGEALLLCSDGMSGLVEDWEIEAIVRAQSPEDAARSLVDKANERGGVDNITVLIVDTRAEATSEAPMVVAAAPTVSGRRQTFPKIPVLIGAAVVMVALLIAGILLVPPLLKGHDTVTAATGTIAGDTGVVPTTTAYLEAPLSPVQTPALSPSPSGEGLRQGETVSPLPPTVTLMPTRTRTPSPSPQPRPTLTPTATSTGAAIPSLPPVQLVAPEEEDAESAAGEVIFRWTYPQPLKEGEAFQVLIWKEGSIEHLGAAEYTRQTEQKINLDGILPARGGPGQYRWSVVVVSVSTGDRLSPEAGPWRLIYVGPPASPEPTTGPSLPPSQPVLPGAAPPPIP